MSLYERIALTGLERFDSLPSKCKPRQFEDGKREWTSMTAIVLSYGLEQTSTLCVSLATGTKCLPSSIVAHCKGMVLHDSHAEILALRAFNRWISDEISRMLQDSSFTSRFLSHQWGPDSTGKIERKPFQFKEDVSIHMFTTEAPCGDASMEILMSSMPAEKAIPWPIAVSDTEPGLLGRGNFSILGAVRRKPARADAEPSLSKSCTDKLALKQFTSVLSFPMDHFIEHSHNNFLQSLIVYSDQYSAAGYTRAFGTSGRLSPIARKYGGKARFFDIKVLPPSFKSFPFSKSCSSDNRFKTSNISAIYIQDPQATSITGCVEVLLNGVKQGFKQLEHRPLKQSKVCRRAMWRAGMEVLSQLCDKYETNRKDKDLYILYSETNLRSSCYLEAKGEGERRMLKMEIIQALGGWIKNDREDNWGLKENSSI